MPPHPLRPPFVNSHAARDMLELLLGKGTTTLTWSEEATIPAWLAHSSEAIWPRSVPSQDRAQVSSLILKG
jgi:hypothetical protein